MSEPLLRLESVAAGYGSVLAVHEVSLQVADGEWSCVLGANGAGKTTLLKTVAGLLPTRGGRIIYAGEDISTWSARQRVEAGLVLVPEGRLVFPTMTVKENLRLGALVPHARARAAERLDEVVALFPRLSERFGQLAHTLSGGEQQMLAVGRALMSGPRLLLMDEASLGLAPVMTKRIFEIVAQLHSGGLTILMAEQDVRQSLSLADRGAVLENGRVAVQGAARELQDDPRIREAYLGL